MSAQTKSKLFLLIIGILLIANIVTLYFLLGNNPKLSGRKKDKWSERDSLSRIFLQKEIGFNTQQLTQFDSLLQKHRDGMKMLMDINKKSKSTQFVTVGKNAFSDSAISTVINTNIQNQKNIDVQLFNYLKNIRAICNQEQIVKYDTSFFKMWDRNKQKNKQ